MRTDEDYQERVNSVEDYLEFHPEAFQSLSAEDQDCLSRYYFGGREVDVDDVFIYRRELLHKEPGLEALADAAYDRLIPKGALG